MRNVESSLARAIPDEDGSASLEQDTGDRDSSAQCGEVESSMTVLVANVQVSIPFDKECYQSMKAKDSSQMELQCKSARHSRTYRGPDR